MNERKILLFILSAVIYCMYSVHMWFIKKNVEENHIEKSEPAVVQPEAIQENKSEVIKHDLPKQTKTIPLYMKNACSVLEVFTTKPKGKKKETMKKPMEEADTNTVTVIGITVFLVVLALNAVLDVIKVTEEEKARKKLNPDGERRQSLAEFANKKTLRRESSKFGLQLFQIAESVMGSEENEEKDNRRKPYTRGDSTNSYLSDKNPKPSESSAPASINESNAEPRLVKRQSVAKLVGARPAPMVRRSSFPALPLNPEVQALMLGHRQASVDSDDESDGKGRRIRIIRRY